LSYFIVDIQFIIWCYALNTHLFLDWINGILGFKILIPLYLWWWFPMDWCIVPLNVWMNLFIFGALIDLYFLIQSDKALMNLSTKLRLLWLCSMAI
jgi:hypothetical protein